MRRTSANKRPPSIRTGEELIPPKVEENKKARDTATEFVGSAQYGGNTASAAVAHSAKARAVMTLELGII